MAIVLGKVLWGVGNTLPELPEGWAAWQRPGEWVMAVSPHGEWYYVGEECLFPQIQRDAAGFYADTDNPILLKK